MDDTYTQVAVLGGGLAGLTLALQLLQRRPELAVTVVDRAERPLPEAAWKVGESTAEAASHYLATVLGLGDHLRDSQLRKFGMRCFFPSSRGSELTDRLELGSSCYFTRPTYQIDRGRFENFLLERCEEKGARILAGHRIEEINLSDTAAPHRIRVNGNGESRVLDARWIIDASGRAGLLRKKLKLHQECSHSVNAVWFRISGRIEVDHWYNDSQWCGLYNGECRRWLSTNHFTGAGFWIWVIPLASQATSIGIVADPRFHELEKLNTLEKALVWLQDHEPRLGSELAARREHIMDFYALKQLARRNRQVFSPNRWGLTGDAAAFTDPLYSPGADFIAYGNTLLTDLITRDLSGQRIKSLTTLYNNIFEAFTGTILDLYEDQYRIFGNPRVMSVKIVWDVAVYWTFPAFLFLHDRLCDLRIISKFADDFNAVTTLNREMQRFFRDWHAEDCSEPPARFVDFTKIPCLLQLNKSLTTPMSEEEFEERLAGNLRELTLLAAEIVTGARDRCPSLVTAPQLQAGQSAAAAPFLGELFDWLESAEAALLPPDGGTPGGTTPSTPAPLCFTK